MYVRTFCFSNKKQYNVFLSFMSSFSLFALQLSKILLTVLTKKKDICLFDGNLREVNVSFKTRGDVSVILINI